MEHADYLSGVYPLGIRKAVHNGGRFDIDGAARLSYCGYAIPAFLFAILCRLLPAAILRYFPLRGWSPPTLTRYRGTRKSPIICGILRCRCWRCVIGSFAA